jgi:hypothetical protein
MIFTGSTYSIVSVVAVTAIIIPAMVVVYRLFFSPFTAVPGPLWAKVSPFWLWIHDLRGTAAEEIDQLHREYGRVQRFQRFQQLQSWALCVLTFRHQVA